MNCCIISTFNYGAFPLALNDSDLVYKVLIVTNYISDGFSQAVL